jgi:DNA-binding transcriptional ArsR family regulator/predicted transcriptional regulator
MEKLQAWARLPSKWIHEGGLKSLTWGGADGEGSSNIAALMTLAAIAHHADGESGIARLTYSQLCDCTYLSRAKVSGGLAVLEKLDVVSREPEGRSTLGLVSYETSAGWAKLPAYSLYSNGHIRAFADFKLRSLNELNALKLYFLFVATRDNSTNMAKIGYKKIVQYTGLDRYRVRPALTVLAAAGLIHIDRVPSTTSEHGISNAYRVVGLEPYKHMGTHGRGLTADDFSDS